MINQPMNPYVRYALIFVGIVVTTLATADPFGLPTWAQVVLGALSTGFAGVGIIPPNVLIAKGQTARAPGTPKYVAFKRTP